MQMKRHIKVVEPEIEDGPVEYKRQINGTATRLRSLGTQMGFRLDEGSGICTYQVGVEDDGAHSLLDYVAIAESCKILEFLAHSLNAIVIERTLIQDEISKVETTNDDNDIDDDNTVSILGDSQGVVQEWPEGLDSNEMKQRRGSGVLTRAQIRIQRIETHQLEKQAIVKEHAVSRVDTLDGTEDDCGKRRTNGNNNNNNNSTTNPSNKPPAAALPGKKASTSLSSRKQHRGDIGDTLSHRNVRIAVMGNVDAGKSTLIGTLTTSSLDDGRGKTRTFIMKHRHEIETGRTSTATNHLMGFTQRGEPVVGRDSVRSKIKGIDEIAKESYRVVTLMDLAGHEKFLKTTIHGVASGFADYALILVNSRQTATHMTMHHLNLCCSFKIPLIVVFTKIDGCPEHALETSKEAVTKMLLAPEISKQPYEVKSIEDVGLAVDKLSMDSTTVPMFQISCVTGHGIDLLQKLFFSLPKRRRHSQKKKRSFEFLVEEIYDVPNVGAVVSGFVNAGELSVGPNSVVHLGPNDDGSFVETVAKSAHIARINTTHVTAGQSATLALPLLSKEMRLQLRPGMVVLQNSPSSTMEFDAEICVLKGEKTTIREPHQAFVHILNIRQSAVARDIQLVHHHPPAIASDAEESMEQPGIMDTSDEDSDKENVVLQPGSRAKVRFEFTQRPEYVRPGMRLLFRDGRVRGVGLVTSVPQV
eukprot:CAMPEP_0168863732 /NCGR_PEP_ID=MMETSP0727-20121128/19099_1 /TAXON_ID=265536 /ORGANISM="Amphiprora sp., Strain CCMP467" /LENGTH=698 /DNA_ID=CAMNT_0008918805 /DNA_START=59 /DNA_END=2155 /DNA_ORIENTATION=-